MLGNRGEDRRRLHAAQTDMRAAGQRHRPGVGPAVAMEHRQRPQIDAARRQAERERIAAGIQIGAAVVQHDALRVAGRARRVVQRDRLPFIVRQPHRKVRVAGGDEWFVLAVDIDHQRPMPALRQRARHHRREFAIDQHDLGFRMLQDERDRCRIQPDVDRAQHRAEHRHGIMRLQHLRNVGGHDRHGIALADAGIAPAPMPADAHAPGTARRCSVARHGSPRCAARTRAPRVPGTTPATAAHNSPACDRDSVRRWTRCCPCACDSLHLA